MHRTTSYLSLLSVVLVSTPLLAADPPARFFFQKGDRIVFLGDSITEQYQYSTDMELYLTTRFPSADMVFLNAGIGGDTATGGAHRFAAHVLAEKPTVVTIDFGMNDGGYGGFDSQRAAQYIKNTEVMLQAAKKAGVRVALISPNAVEVRARPMQTNYPIYLETQKQFYAPLQALAQTYNVPFVDQYAVTRKVLEKMAADNATLHPFPDAVHTNGAGGLLMAHTILTGLKAPAVVTDALIDASGKKTTTIDCDIDEMKITSEGIAFRRTDRAIPMPVGSDWQPLLPYVNRLNDLNYYGLKVTGLIAGKYVLTIDDKKVGEFTSEELGQGVNLGNLTSGPLFDQGQEVLKMIDAKNKIVHSRFRGVVMFNAPDWLADVARERKPSELKKRMAKIQTMQEEIYKKVQPVAHRFELKAMK